MIILLLETITSMNVYVKHSHELQLSFGEISEFILTIYFSDPYHTEALR